MPFTPTARIRPSATAAEDQLVAERDGDLVRDVDLGADEVLRLDDGWEAPARPPIPLVASTVPILGAVALWLVTGSVLALWLAALGPLIAVASIADAARTTRRDRRRAAAEAARNRGEIARVVRSRHRRERERWWTTHPDVARLVESDDAVWRPHADRGETLVIGRGRIPSAVRISGGRGDAAAAELRRRATVLEDAPIAVPLTAGIAVVGPPLLAAAVARAIALQACLLLPPGRLTVSSTDPDEDAWLAGLPHRRTEGARRLVLGREGKDAAAGADARVIRLPPGAPPPPGCRVVLHVEAPDRARADIAGETYEVRPEAIGRHQAEAIAARLSDRADRAFGQGDRDDAPLALAELFDAAPPTAGGGLPAVIGRGDGVVVVDLVDDGPHAVVAGMTGSGKSELLVSWVLALCARHSTREVTFLLADFKGGTAFARLASLPHVTGVITDLDRSAARRAIESLRAEIRWREGELARVGARDIRDERAELPRLVVVVDEFAALLADHPELHALFTDIAARGRALGMHLILGTQRVTGVVRDSLLANAPLRLSLRVADIADSRAVIGTDDAARPLPHGTRGRGAAWVLRSGEVAPERFRVALSSPADVSAIAGRAEGPAPRRSWLPALPSRIDLIDLLPLVHSAPDVRAGDLVLGLLDEPSAQRQRPAFLRARGVVILGASGSGRTTALRTLAAQRPGRTLWVPAEPEGAWDALQRVESLDPGWLIAVDDLDALAARLPADYAAVALEGLERAIRGGGESGVSVAISAQRLSGATGRLAELMPQRVVLATASRTDHLAAGGDPELWQSRPTPGRGAFDGLALQVAVAGDALSTDPFAGIADAGALIPPYIPHALTGFVTRRSPRSRAALREWERAGAAVVDLEAFEAGVERGSRRGGIVVVGEPDEWQRHWRTLGLVRADHDLIVDASCGPEYRVLTADRALPPYCVPGRGRAWLRRAGDDPQRVVLPDTTVNA